MRSRWCRRSTGNTANAGPARHAAQPSTQAPKVAFPGQRETSRMSRGNLARALSPLQETRTEVFNEPGRDIGVHDPCFAPPLFWQTLE